MLAVVRADTGVCPYSSVGGTIATLSAILSPLSSLHSPLFLILIQLRGVDLRDARGLDVGLVGGALDGELRSTAIAC